MKIINRLAIAVLIFVLILSILCAITTNIASAEEGTLMYVMANRLNGRTSPAKKNNIEVVFEKGDWVEAVGWSNDHKWVKVKGGESGTLWCSAQYLTERTDIFKVKNLPSGRSVKIRKTPVNGKVSGKVRGGGVIEVQQVIFGWGRTKKGWIDLEYFVEVNNLK